MKLGSVRYLIKEGFKGTWANRLMSLASIGVLVACMVVIGLAILISQNVNLAIGKLEQQNVIHVYLKDYAWAELSDTEEAETSKGDEIAEEDDETSDASDESEDAAITETADTKSENTSDEQDVEEDDTISDSDYLIHNEEEAQAVCDRIANLDNVKEALFVSSADGLKEATAHIPEENMQFFTFLDEENPISMSIKVTMEDMTYFDETVQKISEMEEVSNIQSYDGLANKINTIKQGISVAGFWIIGILIVISLVIVSNTIRVTMYNRKLEISIMKAVGATDSFVRIPFVIEGMLIGLTSALFSEGIIYFCYRVATEKITEMFGQVVPFGDVAIYLMFVFAGIGVLAGMIGSFIMIGKYLKHEGSEFTAI